MTLPSNLPRLLRAAGLTVVEVDGWQSRSLGDSRHTGVLNHHTGASAKGWSVAKETAYAKWMFLTGRSDLRAPLCNIALGRSGVVYIGAAGRTNHGGNAKASGTVVAGNANYLYIGIEWMLSGTEAIPADMMQAGITLNAVLTAAVTKTSVQTISCHFQTSTTGKWDIGDPNGVPFKGLKVLDVNKFRVAVYERRVDLYHEAPITEKIPPRPFKFVDLTCGHASMQFSDGIPKWRHDAEVIFGRGYEWITGTEAGESATYGVLQEAAKKYKYVIRRFGSNWVAVKRSSIKAGSFRWGSRVIAKTALVAGPGHDTSMVWATFTHTTPGVGVVSVIGSHYPTKGKPLAEAKDPARRVNLKWTTKAGRDIGDQAKILGKGAALVFYGGDQNIRDNISDTFFGAPMTSCWDALQKWPNTGHGNIDVIASYNGDKRVTCVRARAYNDQQLFLHTDHFLIEATYRVALTN